MPFKNYKKGMRIKRDREVTAREMWEGVAQKQHQAESMKKEKDFIRRARKQRS